MRADGTTVGMVSAGCLEADLVAHAERVRAGDAPALVTYDNGADEDLALRVGTALATALMRNCSTHTQEGTLWPVDAALRPEGKQGPLVRTVDSHVLAHRR